MLLPFAFDSCLWASTFSINASYGVEVSHTAFCFSPRFRPTLSDMITFKFPLHSLELFRCWATLGEQLHLIYLFIFIGQHCSGSYWTVLYWILLDRNQAVLLLLFSAFLLVFVDDLDSVLFLHTLQGHQSALAWLLLLDDNMLCVSWLEGSVFV